MVRPASIRSNNVTVGLRPYAVVISVAICRPRCGLQKLMIVRVRIGDSFVFIRLTQSSVHIALGCERMRCWTVNLSQLLGACLYVNRIIIYKTQGRVVIRTTHPHHAYRHR